MTTRIVFNGSRYAGQEPATVDELLVLLENAPLDPRFEHYGDFASRPSTEFLEAYDVAPGGWCFHGNFLGLSHAFSVTTDDADLVAKFLAAIRANKERDDYRAARAERLAECNCQKCFAARGCSATEARLGAARRSYR